MKCLRAVAIAIFCSALNACGTVVPNIQEWSGDSGDGQALVAAMVQSISCEIRKAIHGVVVRDLALSAPNKGKRYANWLDRWGIQVTLTLTIQENSSLNPVVVGLPPSPTGAAFSIAGSGNFSTTATRTETLNFFYTVAQVYKAGPCKGDLAREAPADSPLVRTDLKFDEWLQSMVMLNAVGDIGFPESSAGVFGQKILQHEIKFQVVTSGSLTPAFTLTRALINQSGNFLSAGRDRTHDLLITVGPIDPSQPRTLIRPASDQHLARQIGLAVSSDTSARLNPLP
ncbi:hypothetical protein BV511_14865 [Methylorubrum extorquens]|nr:hypothetical protein BV511_14865 [Methylorubrum extorquens]